MKKIKIYIPVFLFVTACAYGQSTRGIVNDGVEMYNNKKYSDAEVNFKKGIDKDTNNYPAHFNLGDSYYRQGKYDEAVKSYNHSITKALTKEEQAKSLYNMGNSFVKAEKYKEAVDAFKKSLKLNPTDQDTKYNLSYAINKMKENQNQNKNNQNKNDKNNKDNKDKNNKDQNKDNKDNKDKNKDNKQNQNENKQDKNNQDQKQNPKQSDSKMSKQEAERILDAIKNNEKDLQKQLRKKTGTAVKTDKDW